MKTNICVYCGKPIETLNVDHIIPRTLGGSEDKDNMMNICATCNRHKQAKPPIAFIKEILKANKMPFKYPELAEEMREEIDNLKPYLLKEMKSGRLLFRIYRAGEDFMFRLLVVQGKHRGTILSGDILALILLGYDIADFEQNDFSRFFARLGVMGWIYTSLSDDDKRRLLEYALNPPQIETPEKVGEQAWKVNE